MHWVAYLHALGLPTCMHWVAYLHALGCLPALRSRRRRASAWRPPAAPARDRRPSSLRLPPGLTTPHPPALMLLTLWLCKSRLRHAVAAGRDLEVRSSLTLGSVEARTKSCTVLCGSIVIGQPSVPLQRFKRRTQVRRSDVLLVLFHLAVQDYTLTERAADFVSIRQTMCSSLQIQSLQHIPQSHLRRRGRVTHSLQRQPVLHVGGDQVCQCRMMLAVHDQPRHGVQRHQIPHLWALAEGRGSCWLGIIVQV